MQHYKGEDFPIEIDLGKTPDERDMPVSVEGGKKAKRKPYYPTLYINGVEGLAGLPKEGCALIEFRRNRLSVDTPEDGKDSGSVELQIKKICLMEPGDDDGGSLADAIKRGLREQGVEVGDEEEDEEDEA